MVHASHEEDKLIVTLRHSRKSFLMEYVCGLFILFLFFFSLIKGGSLSRLTWPFLILGIFGFISTEIRRFYGDRYLVMENKLSVIKGILKVKKRNVYYQPLGFVPDLNIRQTFLQRILGYGTVFVHVGNTALELRDVDNPNEVLKMLEGLIEKTKRSTQNIMNLAPQDKSH